MRTHNMTHDRLYRVYVAMKTRCYYKKYKLIFALDMLAAFLIAAIGIGYPIITRLMLSRWIPNNGPSHLYHYFQ